MMNGSGPTEAEVMLAIERMPPRPRERVVQWISDRWGHLASAASSPAFAESARAALAEDPLVDAYRNGFLDEREQVSGVLGHGEDQTSGGECVDDAGAAMDQAVFIWRALTHYDPTVVMATRQKLMDDAALLERAANFIPQIKDMLADEAPVG